MENSTYIIGFIVVVLIVLIWWYFKRSEYFEMENEMEMEMKMERIPMPIPTRLNNIRYDSLKETVDEATKDVGADGSVVLIQTRGPSGEREYVVGSGTTERNIVSPPTQDTHYRVGSNTKSMTAAVIVLLAQDEKLSLNDPVSKYFSGVKFGDQITISLLLNMRSGIFNYNESPIVSAKLIRDPMTVFTPHELLDIGLSNPPYAYPDTKYHYCNTNYIMLGIIAEQVTGKPLAKIFHDRLFVPVGMTQSYLPGIKDNTIMKPFSHGYELVDSSYILMNRGGFSPYVMSAVEDGTLKTEDITYESPSWGWAAGGVISTARDMTKWIKALAYGMIFNDTYRTEWLKGFVSVTPDIPYSPEYGYGIIRMLLRGNTAFIHDGQIPGYNSTMVCDVVNNMNMITWANLALNVDDQMPGNAIAKRVVALMYD